MLSDHTFQAHYHSLFKLTLEPPFFVSPELSSVRDYVITHSVRSM